jgi:hypothetical protein
MGVLLNIGGNFPRLRAKLTHMVGHLPIAENSVPFSQTAIPLKDVGFFKETAQQVDSPTPIANLVSDLLRSDSGKA